jgi:putative ABC transport system permease protein
MAWLTTTLETIWQDLRLASRVFAKNRGFAAIAVVSIAFGTGANVASFSLADFLLLRPLPVLAPSELVTIGSRVNRGLATVIVASNPDFVDLRDRARSFSGMLAQVNTFAGFTMQPGTPPQVRLVTMVSSNFFRLLGVEPEIGRSFLPDEDRVAGRDAVAVLSYGTWQQEFAADPSVLGRRIRIAGLDFTIVGVAPERFTGLHPYVREAAFVPLAMWPQVVNVPGLDPLSSRDVRSLTVKARLNPGVTLDGARAELKALGLDLEREYPDTNRNQGLTAQTELEVRFERRPLDAWLLVMVTTLAFAVLCVSCANVAGLLASRAPVRAREIALRMALGAGRARLVRQLITESVWIALAGGLGGLIVGHIGIVLLRQIQLPTEVVSMPLLQINQRALVFSLTVAMASAFVFGLGPAIQTTGVNLTGALKTTDVDVARPRCVSGRSVLVALQVALSLVLLTVSVSSYQVFSRAFAKGPGFRISQMAKMTIDPSQARYTEAQAVQFFERALEDVRRLSGVRSVAVTSAMPLFSFEYATSIVPEDYQLPEGQTSVRSFTNSVDEGYFDTMEIPIVAGRAFRSTDTSDAPLVAIVNETFARHYWPSSDALGRRLRVDAEPGTGRQSMWLEVVGIAKASTYGYFAEPSQDMIYFPFRQVPHGSMVLLAQSAGDSTTLLAPLRDMVRRMDPDIPAYDVQPMEVFYAARVTTIAQVLNRLVGGMGIMGMTITMVGLYGLVSYAVSRRTREIGIRVAIGASYGRVLRMILRQGMTPAGFGLACGLVLSLATVRMLATLIPLNQPYDSSALLVVAPVVLATTLLAAFVPARRAARVDPIIALRCD